MFGPKRSGAAYSLKDKTDNLFESQWAPRDPTAKNPVPLLGKHQNDPAASQPSYPETTENGSNSAVHPDRIALASQASPDGSYLMMHPDRAGQLSGKGPVSAPLTQSSSTKEAQSLRRPGNSESYPGTTAPSYPRVDEDGDIVMEDINDPVVLDQIAEQLAYERKHQEENAIERKDIKYPTPKKQPTPLNRSRIRCMMVVDTCFILSQLHLLSALVEAHRRWGTVVVIPWAVIMELDGLKLSSKISSGPEGDIQVGVLARRANNWAFERLGNAEPGLRGQMKNECVDKNALRGDEAILDCCRYMKEVRNYNTALLSNDKNLCVKALVHGIKTVTFLGQRLHPEDILATVVSEDNRSSESPERSASPRRRRSPSPRTRRRAGAGVPLEPRSSGKRGRSMSPRGGSYGDGRYENDSKRITREEDRSGSRRPISRSRRASVSQDYGSTRTRYRSSERTGRYGTPWQGGLDSSVHAPPMMYRRDACTHNPVSSRQASPHRASNTTACRPALPTNANPQGQRPAAKMELTQSRSAMHKKREPDGDVMMEWGSEVSAAAQRGSLMFRGNGLQNSVHNPAAAPARPAMRTSAPPTTRPTPCPDKVKQIKRAYRDLFNVMLNSIRANVPRLLDRAMCKALGDEETLRYLNIPSAAKVQTLSEIEAFICRSWFTVFRDFIPGGNRMEGVLKQGKLSRQLLLWLNWMADRHPSEEPTPETVSKWTDVWRNDIWGSLCDNEAERKIRDEEYAKWVNLARRILEMSE